MEKTCGFIAEIVKSGKYLVVVTHGNGPQVGNILLQNEAAKDRAAQMPMDVCGAESQGMLGYMIANTLEEELANSGLGNLSVTALLTRTVVKENDPAFKNPTKPVGPFYSKEKAERLTEQKGYEIVNDANRGWRRVVPSPEPVGIVESSVVNKLVQAGIVVITVGGGGIPVTKENGHLSGQSAVIDKDLASAQLGLEINADILAILTDVEHAYLDYNSDNERALSSISKTQASKYIKEGHFAEGSMKPEVKACVRFVESEGEKALITSLDNLQQSLAGKAGTIVTKKDCV